MSTRRAGSRRFGILAPALLLLVLSACSAAPAAAPAPPAPLASVAPPTTPAPSTPLVDVPTVDASLSNQKPLASAPIQVSVPSLKIDMAVDSVGLDTVGSMALPANPATAAWYRFGPGPAAEGATVIAAHVDSLRYGLGPFARLANAPVGTEITLQTADGLTHRYAVESVQSTGKPDVPWPTIFDRTGPSRLTLVTCGGDFNYTTRQYQSNIIVSAIPVP